MAYERYWNYVGDYAAGDPYPAPGCTITVYDAGTLNVSTIFGDSIGTPQVNPFVSGADGFFLFYAAPGTYDVAFSGTGISIPFTWADICLINTKDISYLADDNIFTGSNSFSGGIIIGPGTGLGQLFVEYPALTITPFIVDGKIPALSSTYFTSLSGANLTALNATQLTSGTVPSARLSGTYSGQLVLSNILNSLYGANIFLGADPSSTGALNLTYNESISSDNGAGVDSWLLRFGTSGRLELNDATVKDLIPLTTETYDLGDPTHYFQNSYLNYGYINHITMGAQPSTAGAIRLSFGSPKGGDAGIGFRNIADTDDWQLYLDASDRLVLDTKFFAQGGIQFSDGQVLSMNDAIATEHDVLAIGGTTVIEFGDGTLDIKYMKALVDLGGGAAPTVGTIGGSGPTIAGQYKWQKFVDSAGTTCFIPVWK